MLPYKQLAISAGAGVGVFVVSRIAGLPKGVALVAALAVIGLGSYNSLKGDAAF